MWLLLSRFQGVIKSVDNKVINLADSASLEASSIAMDNIVEAVAAFEAHYAMVVCISLQLATPIPTYRSLVQP